MWKVFTHDYRSPIQGGDAVWQGDLPCDLPSVDLDTGPGECSAGWNFCREMADALRIGGLWPTGRPSLIVQVQPLGDVIHREAKSRTGQLRLVRLATADEIQAGIRELCQCFAPHHTEMAQEVLAWRNALARPQHDLQAIEYSLHNALKTRALPWQLTQFETARAVWDAWAAWDAWDALTVYYASLCGWITHTPDHLTQGIRDAYQNGLAIAIPTGPQELGWAAVEKEEQP